jgi:hypothetical protein
MFKMASKGACTTIVVICHDPLSPTPSNSLDMKTPGNTKQDRDNPEPEDEGDIPMEYSSD